MQICKSFLQCSTPVVQIYFTAVRWLFLFLQHKPTTKAARQRSECSEEPYLAAHLFSFVFFFLRNKLLRSTQGVSEKQNTRIPHYKSSKSKKLGDIFSFPPTHSFLKSLLMKQTRTKALRIEVPRHSNLYIFPCSSASLLAQREDEEEKGWESVLTK